MKFKTLEYEVYDFKDDDLWEAYKDDFQSFTLQTFKDCNQTNIRKLRLLLRVRGVWVTKNRNLTVPESLFNTPQEDKPTEWTEFEIKEHMEAGGEFNSGRITYRLNNGKSPSLGFFWDVGSVAEVVKDDKFEVEVVIISSVLVVVRVDLC